MQIVFWGTYDLGKPRMRILLRGLPEQDLEQEGIELLECHADVWESVEDKSQVHGWFPRLRLLLRWLLAYPGLVWRYLRLPAHELVVVGYLGHLDVLVLAPFARLRRATLVWDVFVPIWETVVEDRRLVGRGHPLALALRLLEGLACRLADRVLLDTGAHAEAFAAIYPSARAKSAAILVGVEPEAFGAPNESLDRSADGGERLHVLFYGQMIPLHGISTLVEAVLQTRQDHIFWTVIGQGQEQGLWRPLLEDSEVEHLRWIPWLPYAELAGHIQRADLCLGIFGESGKAARVIPNKVFQVLAVGKPLATRDSPAIRELLSPHDAGLWLVPPADPGKLRDALLAAHGRREELRGECFHAAARARILPSAIGADLLAVLREAQRSRGLQRG